MAEVSLSEAARALGLDHTTVRRQIKSGRFAYVWRKDDLGNYRIDLGRVAHSAHSPMRSASDPVEALREENAILRERLAGKDELIEELRRASDLRQQSIERLEVLLLKLQQALPATVHPEAATLTEEPTAADVQEAAEAGEVLAAEPQEQQINSRQRRLWYAPWRKVCG